MTPLPLPEDKGPEVEALQGALVELAGEALTLAQPNAPQELRGLLASNEDPMRLTFVLASMFSLEAEKAQSLLEAPTRAGSAAHDARYLTHEVQVLELRNKINTEARSEMTKEQRDYLLRQQMRAIQQELGEKGGEQAEARAVARTAGEGRSARRHSEGSQRASWIGWKSCRPARRTTT